MTDTDLIERWKERHDPVERRRAYGQLGYAGQEQCEAVFAHMVNIEAENTKLREKAEIAGRIYAARITDLKAQVAALTKDTTDDG